MSQAHTKDKNEKVAFVIEGGKKLGFGHFARTTQIAKYLVENKNCGAIFVTNSSVLCGKIRELGFRSFFVREPDLAKGGSRKVCQIIKKESPEYVVIDVKSDHDPSNIIRSLRKTSENVNITLIDNATKARLLADKNICPGIDAGLKDLGWKDYRGSIYSGVKYFPLREEFVHAKGARKSRDSIVITMGAADANNVTTIVMKSLINTGKKVRVIIGPAFRYKREIKTIASKYKDTFELYEDPDNYAQIIASSSLAITALGISIYEISYLGVPIVVIGNYKTDSKAAKALEKAGYCNYLGYYKNVKQKDIRGCVLKLLGKKEKAVTGISKDGIKNVSGVILFEKQDAVVNIAAGHSQLPLIKKLNEMGYKIISVDKNPNAIGFKYSHEKVVMSIYDWKSVLKKLKEMEGLYNYIGAVCKSSGVPAVTTSAIVSYYNLPGIKLDVCSKLIFKNEMADVCRRAGISTPGYINLEKCSTSDFLKTSKFSVPFIVKPSLALVGKKDVRIIKKMPEFKKGFSYCKKKSLNGIVSVQEFIEGNDVTALTIIYKSKVYLSILIDEINSMTKNGFSGVGLVAPSKYESSLTEERIMKDVDKLTSSLGITDGFLALSFRVDSQGKPYLIEVNADLFGDMVLDELLSNLLPNIDVMEIVIKILTKRKVLNIRKIVKKPTAIYYLRDGEYEENEIKQIGSLKQIIRYKKKHYGRAGHVLLQNPQSTRLRQDYERLAVGC